MGPTHECKSLGRLASYLVREDQQRVLRKGLVTWGINNRHFSDVMPQWRWLQYLEDCWVASYTKGLPDYIWVPVMQGIRIQQLRLSHHLHRRRHMFESPFHSRRRHGQILPA